MLATEGTACEGRRRSPTYAANEGRRCRPLGKGSGGSLGGLNEEALWAKGLHGSSLPGALFSVQGGKESDPCNTLPHFSGESK